MFTGPLGNEVMIQEARVSPSSQPSYNWWLRLTSSLPEASQFDLASRERARRSRLVSWLILGLLLADIIVAPVAIGSLGTVVAIAAVFIGLVFAAICNRSGWVTLAGILLVALITAAVFGSIASEPNGLSMFDLPGYDLLAITVIVGASILPPVSAFIIAAINCVLIVLDFALQSPSAEISTNLHLYGPVALVARPIALLLIVAVVSYLWVRGTREQIQRADRAEEVATLEHAYAEHRQQLEVGVQQILATHVRIANGDYAARAPLSQDNALWQIATSLNNLVSRFRTIGEHTNRVGYQLQRTEEEIHRLAVALRDVQTGRCPIWPAPSRTAVDELLPMFVARDRKPPMMPSGQLWEATGQSGVHRSGELAQAWPSSGVAPTTPSRLFESGRLQQNPSQFGAAAFNSGFSSPGFSPGEAVGQMVPESQESMRQMPLVSPTLPKPATRPLSPTLPKPATRPIHPAQRGQQQTEQQTGPIPHSLELDDAAWPELDSVNTSRVRSREWRDASDGTVGPRPASSGTGGTGGTFSSDSRWYLPPEH